MENGKRQAGRKEFKSREDSRDGNGEEKGSNRLKKKKKSKYARRENSRLGT